MLEYVNDLEHYNKVDEIIISNCTDLNNVTIQKLKEGVNFIHMNIRSLCKNYDEFVVFLESLNFSCDIIILTETWHIENIKDYNIVNYNMYYNESKFNQNDGVIIYINNKILSKIEHKKLSEVTISKIHFTLNEIKYNIFAIYRPPSTNVMNFIAELNDFLCFGSKVEFNMLIGDINIDIKKSDIVTNTYINALSSKGFISYINSPTRVSAESSSCLDHVFIKKMDHFKNIDINSINFETSITDHHSTIVNIYVDRNNIPKINVNEFKQINSINYEKLNNMLQLESWENVYRESDVNLAYECFSNKLNILIDKCTQYRNIKINNKLKPWITQGLITSIKRRDSLKKKCLKEKNNLQLWDEYKNYRNYLTKLIKKNKTKLY